MADFTCVALTTVIVMFVSYDVDSKSNKPVALKKQIARTHPKFNKQVTLKRQTTRAPKPKAVQQQMFAASGPFPLADFQLHKENIELLYCLHVL